MSDDKENKSINTSGGIGLPSVLGIVFIILKLTNVIDWRWVWVLAPFWIGASVGILILIFVILLLAVINK